MYLSTPIINGEQTFTGALDDITKEKDIGYNIIDTLAPNLLVPVGKLGKNIVEFVLNAFPGILALDCSASVPPN